MDVKPFTPCINYCQLDDTGTCIGCGRTQAQIAAWGSMTNKERIKEMQGDDKCECEDCDC